MAKEDVQPDGRRDAGDQAARATIGRTIGDFKIRREIGRGEMGIVYEARQVSLNRKVALKVLSGSLGQFASVSDAHDVRAHYFQQTGQDQAALE